MIILLQIVWVESLHIGVHLPPPPSSRCTPEGKLREYGAKLIKLTQNTAKLLIINVKSSTVFTHTAKMFYDVEGDIA